DLRATPRGLHLQGLRRRPGSSPRPAPEERAAPVLREASRVMERLAAIAGGESRLPLGDIDVAVRATGSVPLEPEVALDELADRDGRRTARVSARDRVERGEDREDALGHERARLDEDRETARMRAHLVG